MNTPEFAITAGTAGGLAMLVTTTIVKKLHSDWTAEGRAQALHDLFLQVEERHAGFLRVLPMIKPHNLDEDVFKNVGKTTTLLRTYGPSLTFLKYPLQC